jgi:succinate dehydrogenase/fumarate reductase flavoprotein subunit
MKSSRNYFDYIVVGTGLSSYQAVYELLKKKKNFAVVDVVIDILEYERFSAEYD